MCCGGFGYIDSGAYVIAGLNVGDEIILPKGSGCPQTTEENTTKIVFRVDGFSAICTDGTLLSCHDGNSLVLTDRNLPIEPSLKILVLKVRIFLRSLRSSISRFATNVEDNIWYFQYRLKKRVKTILKK